MTTGICAVFLFLSLPFLVLCLRENQLLREVRSKEKEDYTIMKMPYGMYCADETADDIDNGHGDGDEGNGGDSSAGVDQGCGDETQEGGNTSTETA